MVLRLIPVKDPASATWHTLLGIRNGLLWLLTQLRLENALCWVDPPN